MMLTIVLSLVVASQVNGHSYHFGECPQVKPMEGFDIVPFLGKWYVIQKTATGSSCIINNFTADEKNPGHFNVEQVSEHFLFGIKNPDHKYRYTGDLFIPNPENLADMTVRFPLNVAGGASYIVFMTDYNTYAGIFTCQKLAVAYRSSVSIMSRTNTLDKSYVDEILNRLSTFGVDTTELSIIRQENCTETTEDPPNPSTEEKTYTDETLMDVFRKAGEKIGDGIETVADSVKKVYTTYRGDHGESKENFNEKRDMKNDAEWLP